MAAYVTNKEIAEALIKAANTLQQDASHVAEVGEGAREIRIYICIEAGEVPEIEYDIVKGVGSGWSSVDSGESVEKKLIFEPDKAAEIDKAVKKKYVSEANNEYKKFVAK